VSLQDLLASNSTHVISGGLLANTTNPSVSTGDIKATVATT
jgi:hypothetical protein